MVAAQLTQTPRLAVSFHAFRCHLELKTSAKADNGGNDRLIIGILL
jgi:hypothetical protein